MNRFATVLTIATLGLALGACASDPDMAAAPAAPKPASAPGGQWVVADDYAAEPVGALKSPYLGQPVVLDAARAVDPAGRLCKSPQYWEGSAPAAEALGHPTQPQAAHDPAPRRTVTVTCDNMAFATLVEQPDGTWLTRINAWVLKLDKPAAKPMALTEVAPLPEPAPMAAVEPAPAPEPVKAKPKQDPRTLVYLASYKTEAQAQKGFKTLAKASAVLAKQQPVTHPVDLGKKGKWVRLYGMAADEAERATLCKQLGKLVDECGARNRE